jgi:hypothetical protein
LPEPSEQEALRAVREHLDEAHAAADRLVSEAQRQAEDADGTARESVPPRGWETRRGGEPAPAPDLQALMALLDAVRDVVPAELSRQVAESLRQLLLALRALLDWYIERLGEPAPGRADLEVEDIPLD